MNAIITPLHKHIYSIRGKYIMLDEDLAKLFGVKTKYLNQAVSRNIERFPKKFRFQLSKEEFNDLRCQIDSLEDDHDKILRSQFATLNEKERALRSQNVTLENQWGLHRKYLPYVFTEQGVSMLSAVLRSGTAVKVSIQIMDAFVKIHFRDGIPLRRKPSLSCLINRKEFKILKSQIVTSSWGGRRKLKGSKDIYNIPKARWLRSGVDVREWPAGLPAA